jgi:hypothetical protein
MTSIRWFGVATLSCLVVGLVAFGATGVAAADTANQVDDGCGTLQLDVIDTQGKVTGPFTYVIEETHSNEGIIPRSPFVFNDRTVGGTVSGISTSKTDEGKTLDIRTYEDRPKDNTSLVIAAVSDEGTQPPEKWAAPSIKSLDCDSSKVMAPKGGAPAARFEMSPRNPTVGENVTFSAETSRGEDPTFRWEIYDSPGAEPETFSGETFQTKFDTAGNYYFHLYMTDDKKRGDFVAQNFVVSQGETCNTRVSLDFDLPPQRRNESVEFRITDASGTAVPHTTEMYPRGTDFAQLSTYDGRLSKWGVDPPAEIFGSFKRGEEHVLTVNYREGEEPPSQTTFVPCDGENPTINRTQNASQVDVFEPNDDITNATRITTASERTSTDPVKRVPGTGVRPNDPEFIVGSGNPDYYRIQADAGMNLTASTFKINDKELQLELLDPEGNVIAEGEDAGVAGKQLRTFEDPTNFGESETDFPEFHAGSYYLRVTTDAERLSYRLRATKDDSGVKALRIDSTRKTYATDVGETTNVTLYADAPYGVTEFSLNASLADGSVAEIERASLLDPSGAPQKELEVGPDGESVAVETEYDDPVMENQKIPMVRLTVRGVENGTSPVTVTDGAATTQVRTPYDIVEGITPASEPSDVAVVVGDGTQDDSDDGSDGTDGTQNDSDDSNDESDETQDDSDDGSDRTEVGDAGNGDNQSDSQETSGANGPGFGLTVAVLALLGAAVGLLARGRSR